MEGESSHWSMPKETMHDKDETINITNIVTHVDTIENTMHLVLEQMQEIKNMNLGDQGKQIAMDVDLPEVRLEESHAYATTPILR